MGQLKINGGSAIEDFQVKATSFYCHMHPINMPDKSFDVRALIINNWGTLTRKAPCKQTNHLPKAQ